jgi:hypothetical protein
VFKTHPDYENIQLKVTKGDNTWKFEFIVYENDYKVIRAKIYSKTADKLTSLGVKHL